MAKQTPASTISSVPRFVDVSDVDFAYGEQLVLKHLTLPVERGSTLGVVGPNGGGKTTLLQLLLGRYRPTRGMIRIDALEPRDAVRRGDVVGYLPQNYAVAEDFPISARQVVRLGLVGKTGLFKSHPKADVEFVEWLLGRVGLGELADRPIGSLSGGQRQRVFIARALAARPKLLLLDEPTTGIDRSGQERFREFLNDLKRELGLTVVLVTHDLQTVFALADRIACLNVTLHYHDVPERLSPDLLEHMFACPVEAAGIEAGRDKR